MRVRRPTRRRGLHGSGIILLIFGLVHTPLPQPDFHNIRHHDSPGEVCDYHDHLLRWHPQAGLAEDVATLHWHWFVPFADEPQGDLPGSGLAIHAHISDWFDSNWDNGPLVVPDHASRLLSRLAADSVSVWAAPLVPSTEVTARLGLESWRVFDARALIARTGSLNSLLQRWVC